MRKTVLLIASIASAMLVAYVVTVFAAPPGIGQTKPVTLVGAGDIAGCSETEDSATARLLGRIPGTVLTLGDNAYPHGTAKQFKNCYVPTWGKYKKRTRPVPGNHDYRSADARPYFDYFGWRAGKLGRGYYSYNKGNWHIVALNSNCSEVGGCGWHSPQGRWLRGDLREHLAICTLAYFHHPLYTSAFGTPDSPARPFWKILYRWHADVILSGHARRYERYAPMTPNGVEDPENGIRQFIVGTGGASEGGGSVSVPNQQVQKLKTPGVLKLDLSSGSYHWRFIPIAGKTFTDSGSADCQ